MCRHFYFALSSSALMLFSARPAFAANSSSNEEICISHFAKVSKFNERTARQGPVVREDSHEVITLQHKTVTDWLTINPDAAVKMSDAMLKNVADSLEKQGYVARLEVKPAFNVIKDEKSVVTLPRHNVLVLAAGTAKTKLARELRAYESYVQQRLQDPTLPANLRGSAIPVQIDPLKLALRRANGEFAKPFKRNGSGTNLSAEIFLVSSDAVIEVLRHEKRHLKLYFDAVTGKPNPYLLSFADAKGGLLKSVDGSIIPSIYSASYISEEMKATMTSVVSSQNRLGKITEEMRKKIAPATHSGPAPSEYRIYRTQVEAVRKEGLHAIGKIENFIRSNLESIEIYRGLFGNPDLATAEFAKRMTARDDAGFPGFKIVMVRLDADTTTSIRYLSLPVPDAVVAKGSASVRSYTESQLAALKVESERTQKELEIRRKDLERNRIERLMPPSGDPMSTNP